MKEIINITKISTATLLVIALMFLTLEPTISNAVEDQFTITQSVTAEISFISPTADITMSPALAGITGGTSNGQTTVRVLTNNALGYNMTLIASSSLGMVGNSQGGYIAPLVPTVGIVPNYSFTTLAANTAGFGYTVEASTTGEVTAAFRDNGTNTCNTGATEGVDTCWLNASTTATSIINRATATSASGATTTIKFRTIIMSSPSPAIPQDTYVATTTLTATVNP
jgi:hypothetical protein